MIIIIIIVVVLIILLEKIVTSETNEKDNSIIIKQKETINFSKYQANGYIMTQTELKFYRNLKVITDKLNLSIFSQVNLERIISVKDNNSRDRNKIKSRSIDFIIVNNNNCKIVCCIELDDYTHNYKSRMERDQFINQLFNSVNVKLYRIKVNNNYNLEELQKMIKENL